MYEREREKKWRPNNKHAKHSLETLKDLLLLLPWSVSKIHTSSFCRRAYVAHSAYSYRIQDSQCVAIVMINIPRYSFIHIVVVMIVMINFGYRHNYRLASWEVKNGAHAQNNHIDFGLTECLFWPAGWYTILLSYRIALRRRKFFMPT